MPLRHLRRPLLAARRGRFAALLLGASLGLASCAQHALAPAPQDNTDATRSGAGRPQPRPSAMPASPPAMPTARDPGPRAAAAGAGVAAPRPGAAAPDTARTAVRAQRRAAVLDGPAPKSCIAADAAQESLPLLPAADRDTFQQLLAEGANLFAERGKWQIDVRLVKQESARRYMNAPGFGCMNPGLGYVLQQSGRADDRSSDADIDCVAEAKGTPGSGGIQPTFMSAADQAARTAVTERVKRLKAQDIELSHREEALALSLAQLLKRASGHWQQAPARSWTLGNLAGMETLRNQVVLQCIPGHARPTAASDALIQQATSALPAVFDAVLPLQAAQATAALASAGTGPALGSELKSLFPTPLLDQRARLQPWLTSALQKEQARVAIVDARLKREGEAKRAEYERRAWENSAEFQARQRYRQNAAANTAPTAAEVQALLIDYLIADRGDKFRDFDRKGNRLVVTVTVPVMGTMLAYLGEVNLTSLSCKPKDRKQFCELEYTERKIDGPDHSAFEPTGSINRRHGVDFIWSELEGLQSPGLKAAIVQAHKDWHVRVEAALRRQKEIEDAMDSCKGGLPAAPTERDRRRCAGRF